MVKPLIVFCLLLSVYDTFSQNNPPDNPIPLLINTIWKVDRRRLTNTDIQNEKSYKFLNPIQIQSENLFVYTKDKKQHLYTWAQLRHPNIRISIVTKPGMPAMFFQYAPNLSDKTTIVFVEIPQRNIPSRYCFQITLKK